MPRLPSRTFTDRELEIMKVIWELGEASARQIQERLPGDRHYNSVMTIIRVLEKKGRLTYRTEGRAHVYRAAESREKSRKRVLRELVKQVFGGSASSLVLHLVDTGALTQADLDEIRRQVSSPRRKESDR